MKPRLFAFVQKLPINVLALSGILSLGLLATNTSNAFFPAGIKTGEVLARTVVLSEAGNPIFVVFDKEGKIAEEIGEAAGDLEGAFMLSVGSYNAYVDQMNDYLSDKDGIGKGSYLMTRDDYLSAEFKTLDQQHILQKPNLRPDTAAVVVRGQETLLSKDDNPLLMEAPINLFDASLQSEELRSMLINKAGETVKVTALNIGYKAEYYKDPDNRKDPLGPVPGIVIQGGFYALGGEPGGMTDNNGRYTFAYVMPPCPGFTFEYTTNVYARLYYKNFHPRGAKFGTYHMMRQGWDFCDGLAFGAPGMTLGALMAQVNAQAEWAARSVPVARNTFSIDVYMVTGQAVVANPDGQTIEMTDKTEYGYEQPDFATIIHNYDENGDGTPDVGYDFDGDGKQEKIVLGNLVWNEEKQRDDFVAAGDGQYQGIYLSSGSRSPEAEDPELKQPDFTRIRDRQADFTHQGLLKTISKEDLKKTDLYIFRESNGQLITERRGMKTEELFNDGDVDEEKKKIYYRVMIRGAMDAGNPLRGNFTDWQAKAKMNPELYQRKADHLRPGENLRIILINRQTGYIGSLTTPLKNINEGGYGAISFPIAEIKMLPPNLSVRVERRTSVEHGLTKNEERHYQVGYEGGATANDNVIEIFTEWYEQDGRPLPEELGEYGYTGRLAKIVAENELAPEGGDLANFTIKPGKNRQVIRVKDEAITREHYYVHVHAESKNNNPDFATLGAGEGKLQYRPAHYVPFKVAVFDEKATIISRNAWRRAREQGQVEGRFPLPVYRWLYRPEMQFSLFELQMKKILHGADGEDGEDMLHAETPGLSNVDDFVNLSYNLLINDIAPLPLLGEERELLFAIGEQELAATVGSDQQLRFRNLNHLTALRPEDFLTMRLYFNHDPENLLWEFAFEYLALSTTIVGSPAHGGGLFRVSADEPTVPMVSWLVGYGQRDTKYKSPKTLRWVAEGTQAAFENEEVDQENGVFTATVAMPRTAGARTTVNAILEGNPDIIAKWGEILVVPGEPHDLQTTVDGEMHIERHGTVTVDVTSVDKYNNKVADGTQIAYEVIGPVNIETKQDEFIDGKARIVLSGDSLVDPEAKLTIRVGELTREIPLQVKPLKVTWEALPPTFETRKTYNLSVKVTTEAGEPAAGVDVIFDSNFGKFEQGLPKTDAQGIATIRFFTGLHEKTGRVSARVGLVEAKHKEVTPSSPIPQKANTSETILVGDATIDGAVEYVRYDGLRIGVPYRAKANVLINDNVGSQHDLKIGSLAEPNRAPLASYFLNQLDYTVVPDETGLHHGRGEKVTLVGDHPLGMGQSLFFGADAKVEVTAKPSLQPADGLGFRLDIKPYQPGDVIKLAAGTQKVEYTADNRIQFTVTTTAGPVSIASHVLSLNEWHTVGARVLNGQLELEVNGQAATPVAVPNPLAYGFGQGIEMGGFEGLLSSVSLYDWRSSPLVKFSENGQEQLSFTVADGEGGNAISVESTGALNSAQQDSAIRTLRVGLTLASEQHYISLVDRDFYGELMGSAVAHGSSAPPVQFDENGQLIVRNQFKAVPLWDSVIPVAHAGIFDWIAENAWEIFTEAIGFVIPFNEAKSLFEQVGYMMDNEWDKVNYVTLTFDAMSILSFVAPPIRAAMVPLRRIIAPLANKPFVKAIGGVIGTYAGKLRKGKFDDLLKLVPYFMILGEMAFDEEGREALLVMFNGIESADDFLVWVDYLSLPALGWDGEGEPPPVDTEGAPVDDVVVAANFEFQMYQSDLMGSVFSKAYAAKPTLKRIAGQGVKKLVSGAAATKAARERPKEITNSMKSIRELMLDGGSKNLRKMIFNPKLLISTLRRKASESAYGVTALLTGKSNARLHAALIIGVFAYLEDRMNDCEISKKLKLQGCIPIPEHSPLALEHHTVPGGVPEGLKHSALHNEIDKLFLIVIKDAASKPEKLGEEDGENESDFATYVQGYAQGAMWHLAMIAFHHASYEVTGEQPIVALERGVRMDLYEAEDNGVLKVTTKLARGKPLRKVDIELGNGSDGTDNTWVEVKSLGEITVNTKSKHECQWTPWVMLQGDTYDKPNISNTTANGCKTRSLYAKQFFLDARATTMFTAAQEGTTYAKDMKWLLQNFKVNSKTFKRKNKPYTIKAEKSYSKVTYDRTVSLLRRMSEPAATKLNLGGIVDTSNGLVSKNFVESHLRRATFVELIKGQIQDKFLKDLPQEIIDEMMQEEFVDE